MEIKDLDNKFVQALILSTKTLHIMWRKLDHPDLTYYLATLPSQSLYPYEAKITAEPDKKPTLDLKEDATTRTIETNCELLEKLIVEIEAVSQLEKQNNFQFQKIRRYNIMLDLIKKLNSPWGLGLS